MSDPAPFDASSFKETTVDVPVALPQIYTNDKQAFKTRTIEDIIAIWEKQVCDSATTAAQINAGSQMWIYDVNSKKKIVNFADWRNMDTADDKPNEESALSVYFGARFHREQIKNVNERTIFKFNVGSKNAIVHYYRNYTGQTDATNLNTNDANALAAIGMTKLFTWCYKNNKRWPIPGHIRVQVSDDNIKAISTRLFEDDRPDNLKRAILALNIGGLRNTSPFHETEGFDATLAAAMKIAQLGAAKNPSQIYTQITLKQLKKLMNTGQVDLESEKILDLINLMGAGGSLDADSVEAIFRMARSKKLMGVDGYYQSGKTMKATGLKPYPIKLN